MTRPAVHFGRSVGLTVNERAHIAGLLIGAGLSDVKVERDARTSRYAASWTDAHGFTDVCSGATAIAAVELLLKVVGPRAA